ncbi:adhesion domain-containing protein [Aliivibrio fischeri]|uniref:adhesion domain-containing protein n=1 Tax=Aliivibrio fischeri TaxID=668 RepID=UPI000907E0EC|nr:DUF1566 domain-containing protein [Aliivibrio fischeri]
MKKSIIALLLVNVLSPVVMAAQPMLIPQSEANNSWFNQTNNYRFNNSEPLPGTAGINLAAGAFIIQNKGEYQSVMAFGNPQFGGEIEAGSTLDELLAFIKPSQMYASGNAFLALDPVFHHGVAWGNGVIRGEEKSIENIQSVYPGTESFMIVKTDGSLIEYTPSTGTENTIDAITSSDPIRSIYHSGGTIGEPIAWVALLESGKIKVWGDDAAGGTISEDAKKALKKEVVQSIYTTKDAFLVKTQSNKYVAWGGDNSESGTIPNDISSALNNSGSSSIQATEKAFAVISNSTIYAWGDDACGGKINSSTSSFLLNMKSPQLSATRCSFIATDISTGKLAQWGNLHTQKTYGENTPLVTRTSNEGALVLDREGNYIDALQSAELSPDALNAFVAPASETIASGNAFAAVNHQGLGAGSNILNSWANGANVDDITLTCDGMPIDLYSTQAPDNSVSYFLAYHPSCGDEITTWKTGEESLPSVSSLRITPDVPVIGEKLKGDYLYIAADSGAEEKNSLRTWTVVETHEELYRDKGTEHFSSTFNLKNDASLVGQHIEFCVVPKSTGQIEGNQSCITSLAITEDDDKYIPTCSNDGGMVTLSSGAKVSCPVNVEQLDQVGSYHNYDGYNNENGYKYPKYHPDTAKQFCEGLRIGGSSSWTLPTIWDLKTLQNEYGDMGRYQWPTNTYYWSSTVSGSGSDPDAHFWLDLSNGNSDDGYDTYTDYVTCIDRSDVH